MRAADRADPGPAQGSTRAGVAPWLTVCIVALFGLAFWPALLDLGAHWVAQPWARYSILFALLWAFELAAGARSSLRIVPGARSLGQAGLALLSGPAPPLLRGLILPEECINNWGR